MYILMITRDYWRTQSICVPKEKGEMTPHEAEPDLPVSDAGSLAEVCVSGGLLCGPGRGVLAKVCLEVTFSPNIESVVSG